MIGCDIPATVELNVEINDQPTLLGPRESHREQHEIRLELELGPGHSREVSPPIGEHLPLETDSVNPLHLAIVPGERGGSDAPLPIAPLLVRV